MKKHWSAIAGLPVVVDDDPGSLGALRGAFMDPEKAQIIGFLVSYTQVLVPMEIEKWHQYFVQVGSEEALAPVLDIFRIEQFGLRRTFLNGKRVLSKSGEKLGKIRDFCFDSMTHALLTFEVSKRFLWLEWSKRIFEAKDIEEVTPAAIILNVDLEGTEKVKLKKEATAPAPSA